MTSASPEEEESIAVSDSETGFSIGEEKYETEGTATASPETPGGEAETPDTTPREVRAAESQGGGTYGRDRTLSVGRAHCG